MKKLFYLALCAIFCLGLTACGNDDNNGGGSYEELIVGKWSVVKIYDAEDGEWETFNPAVASETVYFSPSGSGYTKGYEKEGGYVHNWEDLFEYEITNNYLILYYEQDDFYEEMDIETFKIKKLNQKELVLSAIEEEDDNEYVIYLKRIS